MKEWTLPANLEAETWLTLRQMPYLSNKKYSKFHINVMFGTRIKKVLAKSWFKRTTLNWFLPGLTSRVAQTLWIFDKSEKLEYLPLPVFWVCPVAISQSFVRRAILVISKHPCYHCLVVHLWIQLLKIWCWKHANWS